MEDKTFKSHLDAPEYPEHLLHEQPPEHSATIEEIRKFYESAEKNVPLIVIPAKSQKTPPIDNSNSLESEHLNENKKKDD